MSFIKKIPGFRSGILWKKIIAFFFYAVILLIVLALFGDTSDQNVARPIIIDQSASTVVESPPTVVKPRPSVNPVRTITIGEENALMSAQSYLQFTAFSRSGLIKQLEFEGYSNSEATYAADNVGANWNYQAVKSAESYLQFTSFSRQGLIDQLKFEGFTREQAEYGVKAVGY